MDQAIFHRINEQWTSPGLDLFMAAASHLDLWWPLIVPVVLLLLLRGGFKGRAFVLCAGVTLFLTEAVVVRGLKEMVGRPRPKDTQSVRLVQLARARPQLLSLFKEPRVHRSENWQRNNDANSFPSGHTANNFVVATFCALFYRRRGWLYFFVAAAVGYSRVYLGAHWPSDVLGTMILAVGLALAMAALYQWLWKRVGPRWTPELFARHPRVIGES